MAGASKVLMPEKLWCQQSSGVSIVLVSAFLWCQHCSGTGIVLVPAFFWCQYSSGVSIPLVISQPLFLRPQGPSPRQNAIKHIINDTHSPSVMTLSHIHGLSYRG